jgi:hypothetical protein
MTWKRYGGRKVIIAPDGGDAWVPANPRPDETLIRALTRASVEADAGGAGVSVSGRARGEQRASLEALSIGYCAYFTRAGYSGSDSRRKVAKG